MTVPAKSGWQSTANGVDQRKSTVGSPTPVHLPTEANRKPATKTYRKKKTRRPARDNNAPAKFSAWTVGLCCKRASFAWQYSGGLVRSPTWCSLTRSALGVHKALNYTVHIHATCRNQPPHRLLLRNGFIWFDDRFRPTRNKQGSSLTRTAQKAQHRKC